MTANTESPKNWRQHAAEHLRQISPRGWRAPRAELLMRARSGP